jgi:hypothetical protein
MAELGAAVLVVILRRPEPTFEESPAPQIEIGSFWKALEGSSFGIREISEIRGEFCPVNVNKPSGTLFIFLNCPSVNSQRFVHEESGTLSQILETNVCRRTASNTLNGPDTPS